MQKQMFCGSLTALFFTQILGKHMNEMKNNLSNIFINISINRINKIDLYIYIYISNLTSIMLGF